MTEGTKGVEYSVSVRISNSGVAERKLVLEPWGEEYTMRPSSKFDVVARGPVGDCLEVEVADDYIFVYGWPGSVVSLFQDGVELGSGLGERAPVPPTPRQDS